jgi:ketosteroid isomerase-like protein
MITAMAAALMAATTVAAAPTDDLMTVPKAFIDNLDAGKIDAAGATMTADVTIIDEFTPYAWSGPDAFKRWLADFGASNTAGHVVGAKVKLGDAIVTQAAGDTAYVVASAEVFALRRDGGAWKIASWAWAGRKPHPAVKGS